MQAGCPISPLPKLLKGVVAMADFSFCAANVGAESLKVNFASETAPRMLFDNVRTMIHIQTLFFMVGSETVAAISSSSDEVAQFLG